MAYNGSVTEWRAKGDTIKVPKDTVYIHDTLFLPKKQYDSAINDQLSRKLSSYIDDVNKDGFVLFPEAPAFSTNIKTIPTSLFIDTTTIEHRIIVGNSGVLKATGRKFLLKEKIHIYTTNNYKEKVKKKRKQKKKHTIETVTPPPDYYTTEYGKSSCPLDTIKGTLIYYSRKDMENMGTVYTEGYFVGCYSDLDVIMMSDCANFIPKLLRRVVREIGENGKIKVIETIGPKGVFLNSKFKLVPKWKVYGLVPDSK